MEINTTATLVSNVKRAYADTSLGQMHYLMEGDGPLLLAMHATTYSARLFAEFVPVLADEYRVVAPDLFGFGNSDPLPADITIPRLVTGMGEFVAELGAESAHVLGHHTGNKIGAAMAARTPERVNRLILCGQPHSIIPDEEERDAVIRGRVAEDLRTFAPTADGTHLLKEWGRLNAKVSDAWWDREVLSGETVTPEAIDGLADRVLAAIQSRGSLRTIYEANFDYDWTADLKRIDSETLVLELATPAEEAEYGLQGDRVADIVPDCSVVTVDDVDDGVFRASPEHVAAPVRDFLPD